MHLFLVWMKMLVEWRQQTHWSVIWVKQYRHYWPRNQPQRAIHNVMNGWCIRSLFICYFVRLQVHVRIGHGSAHCDKVDKLCKTRLLASPIIYYSRALTRIFYCSCGRDGGGGGEGFVNYVRVLMVRTLASLYTRGWTTIWSKHYECCVLVFHLFPTKCDMVGRSMDERISPFRRTDDGASMGLFITSTHCPGHVLRGVKHGHYKRSTSSNAVLRFRIKHFWMTLNTQGTAHFLLWSTWRVFKNF